MTTIIEQSGAETQAAFVAGMQSPVAYPHATHRPIRCIETHISRVFLTGQYAYKVKRPVRLGFVDYSTAARRAACCHEELRLNRRYAPGLYLDVVPIGGTVSHPLVGSSNSVFEHALRMVQFEPGCELSALLEGATVDATEIATLGADVARLHASATVADAASEWGVPAHLHEVTLANFTELAQQLQDDVGASRLASLRSHAESLFGEARVLLEERRNAGFVRECHGDMHCGNVVRWRERLTPFDGLEFDPALRYIDVASDVAFLSMDLAVRGRADLRRHWLNAWCEASGDFAAVELLPYFETYRALVRAKVTALHPHHDRVGREESVNASAGYLRWVEQNAQRAPPSVVLMVGLTGSGKTWLARQLVPRLHAFHVRSDVERKRLAGLGPLESSSSQPDAGIYSRDFNEKTYARLLDCARHCVNGHESVIIDAASLRRRERRAFASLAQASGARFRMVHCVAPLEELRVRVAQRHRDGLDASEATEELLARQPGYWEPFDESELAAVIDADTTSPTCLALVCEALGPVTRS